MTDVDFAITMSDITSSSRKRFVESLTEDMKEKFLLHEKACAELLRNLQTAFSGSRLDEVCVAASEAAKSLYAVVADDFMWNRIRVGAETRSGLDKFKVEKP